jgi:Fe-S-cluster containining protein
VVFKEKAIMNIITDISIIEDLASKRQEENWRFRAYLKGANISGSRIDSAVHMLARWVSKQVDCGKCANCCKACSPILQMPDIQRMAKHFDMEPASFQQKYLANEEEENGHYFREMPCPFLQENRCTIYKQRPNDCRSYPHLHKTDFVFRLSQAVSNCSVCPIVFNVYEELKVRFWKARD